MRVRTFLMVLVTLGLLAPIPALAETYVFGALDLGAAGLVTNVVPESNKFGFDGGVKGLLSMESDKFVLDLGVGWRFDYLRGGATSFKTNIETRNAFVEASPRIRVGQTWQLGPLASFHFGSQVGMAELLTQSQTQAFYAGAQLVHEWGTESTRYRFGLRGGVSLNIASRVHWFGGVTVQVGVKVFGGGSSSSEAVPPSEPAVLDPSPFDGKE